MAPKRNARGSTAQKNAPPRTTRRTTRQTSAQPDASPLAQGLPETAPRRRTRATSTEPLAEGLPDTTRRPKRRVKAKIDEPTPEPVIQEADETNDEQTSVLDQESNIADADQPHLSSREDSEEVASVIETTEHDHVLESVEQDEETIYTASGAAHVKLNGASARDSSERDDLSVQADAQVNQELEEAIMPNGGVGHISNYSEWNSPRTESEQQYFSSYYSTHFNPVSPTTPPRTSEDQQGPSVSKREDSVDPRYDYAQSPRYSPYTSVNSSPEPATQWKCDQGEHVNDYMPEWAIKKVHTYFNDHIDLLPLETTYLEAIEILVTKHQSPRILDSIAEHELDELARRCNNSIDLPPGINFIQVIENLIIANRHLESQRFALSQYILKQNVDPADVIVAHAEWIDNQSSIASGEIEDEYEFERLQRGFPPEKEKMRKNKDAEKEEFQVRRRFEKSFEKSEKEKASHIESSSVEEEPDSRAKLVSEVQKRHVDWAEFQKKRSQLDASIASKKAAMAAAADAAINTPKALHDANRTVNGVADSSDESMAVDEESSPTPKPILQESRGSSQLPPATPTPASKPQVNGTELIIETPVNQDSTMVDDSDDENSGWGIRTLMRSASRNILASVGKYLPGYTPVKRQRVEVNESGSPSKPLRQKASSARPASRTLRHNKAKTPRTALKPRSNLISNRATNLADARVLFEETDSSLSATPDPSSPSGAVAKRKRDAVESAPVFRSASPFSTSGANHVPSSIRRRGRRQGAASRVESSSFEEAIITELPHGFEERNYQHWLQAAGHNKRMWPNGPPDLRDPTEQLPRFPHLPWTTDYVELKNFLPSATLGDNFSYMGDLKWQRRQFRAKMVEIVGLPRETRLKALVQWMRMTDTMDYSLILRWFSPSEDEWRQWIPGFKNFDQFSPCNMRKLVQKLFPDVIVEPYNLSAPGVTYGLDWSDESSDEDDALEDQADIANNNTVTVENKSPWTQAPPAAPVPAHATLPKATSSEKSATPVGSPSVNIFSMSANSKASNAPATSKSAATTSEAPSQPASTTPSKSAPAKAPATMPRTHIDKHKPAVPSKLSQELGKSSPESDSGTVVKSVPRPGMSTLNQPVAAKSAAEPTSTASPLKFPTPVKAPSLTTTKVANPASKTTQSSESPAVPTANGTPLISEHTVKMTGSKKSFAQPPVDELWEDSLFPDVDLFDVDLNSKVGGLLANISEDDIISSHF